MGKVTVMSYGWICPKCGRVNAPWMPYCPCSDDSNKSEIQKVR